MGEGKSGDFPVEVDDSSVDESSGPLDPMMTTMESAADGKLPKPAGDSDDESGPDIEIAMEDRPTIAGDTPPEDDESDDPPVSWEPPRAHHPPAAGPSQAQTSQQAPQNGVDPHAAPAASADPGGTPTHKPPRPPPRSRSASIPATAKPTPSQPLPPPRKKVASLHDGHRSGSIPPSATLSGRSRDGTPASVPPSTGRHPTVPPRPRSRPPRPASRPPAGLAGAMSLPTPNVPSVRGPVSSAPRISQSNLPPPPASPSVRPRASSLPPVPVSPFGSPPLPRISTADTSPSPSAVDSTSQEAPLDEPTSETSSDAAAGTHPGMGIDFVRGDDDSVDLAKTQKFERRAAYGDDDDDIDIDSPPLIPFLADDDDDGGLRGGTRRRRSRKGKRRTVKIPDDNVPSTPTPPAVTTAQLASAPAEDEHEPEEEGFDAAATVQRPIVAAAGSPFSATASFVTPASEITGTGAAGASPSPAPSASAPPNPSAHAPSEPPPVDDDEIYDAPTVHRAPDDELRARIATLPDPTAPSPTAPSPTAPSPTAPSPTAPSPTAPSPTAPDPTAPFEPRVDTYVDEDPHRRESAPGIFTDDSSISVLRPIQVVSDLPAMQGLAPTKEDSKPPPPRKPTDSHLANRRPLPPPRAKLASEQMLAEIEEIVPDRMSLPGPTADAVAMDFLASPVAVAPAVIAPAAAAPAAAAPAATVDPVADTMQRPAMTAAEADLAVAEARAREAEAKAVALEAKARAAAAKADAARTKTARPPKKPWYQVIFEDELVRTLDNPNKLDVERESTFIEESLRLDRGSRILDLCCGTGVHAVELASRGYQVVGVDLSTTMLRLAQEYNNSRGTSVSFIQGDMRKLNLEGVFDGIYCWSSSFGFFDEKQNAEVLERVARALRPGGMFALDVTNRDFVAPNSPSMAWFEKPGVVCMDETRFDFFTSRLHTKRMVLFDTGKSSEVEMSMRLYTLTELGRLLQKVGFEVLEVSGHRVHRGAYFGPCSPRIIVTSRRKAD